MKVVPPEFRLKAFTCPHCSVFSHMESKQLHIKKSGELYESTEFFQVKCSHCRKSSVWIETLDTRVSGSIARPTYNKLKTIIYPTDLSGAEPALDMPEEIKADYSEARSIAASSPRAAAALLRLALQKLLAHLGSEKGSINEAIGDLVQQGKITGHVTKVADALRIIGNDSVHPGKMDDKDRSELTNKLFDFINFFVYETITRPKEIESMYSILPEGARKAVDKRDGK